MPKSMPTILNTHVHRLEDDRGQQRLNYLRGEIVRRAGEDGLGVVGSIFSLSLQESSEHLVF